MNIFNELVIPLGMYYLISTLFFYITYSAFMIQHGFKIYYFIIGVEFPEQTEEEISITYHASTGMKFRRKMCLNALYPAYRIVLFMSLLLQTYEYDKEREDFK